MRTLLYIIAIQELYYAAFLAVISLIVGVENGWQSAIKTFAWALFFFQFIILLINREVLKRALRTKIRKK